MSLRWTGIGSLALFTLMGCSSEPDPQGGSGGSGGSGANTGGMTTGGGGSTSTGGGGTNSVGGGGTNAGGGGTTGGSVAAGGGGTSSVGGGGTNAGGGGTSAGGGGSGGTSGGSGGAASKTTFFVTSDTSKTGKLGGLEGADKRCNDLAAAAGITGHVFKAYLSAAGTDAKSRIGPGPWYNQKGILIAMNVADLHNAAMVKGSADLFITEKGDKVNGQWAGSPTPNEHDILTGSNADGTIATGKTCMDWTSDSAQATATVGHSDGLGPGMATTGTYTSWNAAHEMQNCSDTAPRGGAGRIYCFASN